MFAPGQNQLLANLSLLLFLRIFRSFVFMILKRTFEECVSLFSYQRSFCIAVCLKQLCYYIMSFPACQELFFNFFEVVFVSLLQQLWYLITSDQLLSRTFSFLFIALCQTQLVYVITSLFRCQELFSFLFSTVFVSCNSDRIPLYTWFVNSYFHVFLFFCE